MTDKIPRTIWACHTIGSLQGGNNLSAGLEKKFNDDQQYTHNDTLIAELEGMKVDPSEVPLAWYQHAVGKNAAIDVVIERVVGDA